MKNVKLFEALATVKMLMKLFCGCLNHDYDVEGLDRENMKLPYEQDILIEELRKSEKIQSLPS